MTQISLLLGAGFSVNQGYPTAEQINKKLMSLNPEDFWVDSAGTVLLKSRDKENPCWFLSYATERFFIVELIDFYQNYSKKDFNYEEFYDFYNKIYRNEIEVPEFSEFCEKFRKNYHTDIDNRNLLSKTNNIFNQLIKHFLVDKEGNSFYESVHYGKPILPGYTGFLNCIEGWGENGVVHIHTLNHDIFFECFKNSDWIQGNLDDGFKELGSPFYGSLGSKYKVRLPCFTNEYNEKYRLYKLHGSVDQFPFHIQNNGVDTYVKIKFGISSSELFKEVEKDGKPTYINDWLNYHPDFLSGTTSKILRYRESSYYEKVFKRFENNLINSEMLVLIGYGCGDIEINNLIRDKFDYQNKPIIVVEPYPSKKTMQFIQEFDGKLIEKTPENLNLDDF